MSISNDKGDQIITTPEQILIHQADHYENLYISGANDHSDIYTMLYGYFPFRYRNLVNRNKTIAKETY